VILNVAVRKQAPTVPLPAPKYWQSRHQHTRVVIGVSALSQRTAPQRHLPVTVIALSNIANDGMLGRTSYAGCMLQFSSAAQPFAAHQRATAGCASLRARMSSNVSCRMRIRLINAKLLAIELGRGQVSSREKGYYLVAGFVVWTVINYAGVVRLSPLLELVLVCRGNRRCCNRTARLLVCLRGGRS
jgi:hypothetical protein